MWIRVKTVLDEELTGQVYFHDSNYLILERKSEDYANKPLPPHVTPKSDFIILTISSLKDIISVSGEPFEPISEDRFKRAPMPKKLHLERLIDREEKALRRAVSEMSRIGVNVSKEAQSIFDQLVKTLPCKWEGETIIVLDEISITPPYNAENCKGSNLSSLERVKKVLQVLRRRMK